MELRFRLQLWTFVPVPGCLVAVREAGVQVSYPLSDWTRAGWGRGRPHEPLPARRAAAPSVTQPTHF